MSEQNKKNSFADIAMLSMVVLMSVVANLPEELAIGLDQRYLTGGLIAVVAVSLVRYLKFTLVLVVAILMVGANLPSKMAEELGVNTNVMIFALIAMVVVSLSNKFFKLSTGVEPSKKTASSSHGTSALFNAIAKGRMSMVQNLLNSQGVSANLTTKEGYTPLIFASAKGYGDMVQLLLEHGADINAKDKAGKTALVYAKDKGFVRVIEILRAAGATN